MQSAPTAVQDLGGPTGHAMIRYRRATATRGRCSSRLSGAWLDGVAAVKQPRQEMEWRVSSHGECAHNEEHAERADCTGCSVQESHDETSCDADSDENVDEPQEDAFGECSTGVWCCVAEDAAVVPVLCSVGCRVGGVGSHGCLDASFSTCGNRAATRG